MPPRSARYQQTSSVFVFVFVVLCCNSLHCNCVQLTLALLCDHPATAFLHLLNKAHLLKLLQDVPNHLPGGLGVYFGASAATMLASIDLSETADASSFADVKFPHN